MNAKKDRNVGSRFALAHINKFPCVCWPQKHFISNRYKNLYREAYHNMDIFESRNLHPFQCCKADDEILKKPASVYDESSLSQSISFDNQGFY